MVFVKLPRSGALAIQPANDRVIRFSRAKWTPPPTVPGLLKTTSTEDGEEVVRLYARDRRLVFVARGSASFTTASAGAFARAWERVEQANAGAK